MNASDRQALKERAAHLLRKARDHGRPLSELATLCERSEEQVDRYLAGINYPSPKVSARIIKALGGGR